jgi:hypothetical protein
MASPSDFIEDGHRIHFRWDRDELIISYVECPHQAGSGMCNRMRTDCVVAAFVSTFGPELNIGSTSIDGPIEVAWYPVLGESDLDRQFRHVWLVPVLDPDFVAAKYMESQKEEDEPEGPANEVD